MDQLGRLYSPDYDPGNPTYPQVQQVQIAHKQLGGVDCGLFAIAYAVELAFGEDPSNVVYDQVRMRTHLSKALVDGHIKPFPRHRTLSTPRRSVDATMHIDENKLWYTPRKTAPHRTTSSPTSSTPTENRFEPLSDPHTTVPPSLRPNRNISTEDGTNPPDVTSDNTTSPDSMCPVSDVADSNIESPDNNLLSTPDRVTDSSILTSAEDGGRAVHDEQRIYNLPVVGNAEAASTSTQRNPDVNGNSISLDFTLNENWTAAPDRATVSLSPKPAEGNLPATHATESGHFSSAAGVEQTASTSTSRIPDAVGINTPSVNDNSTHSSDRAADNLSSTAAMDSGASDSIEATSRPSQNTPNLGAPLAASSPAGCSKSPENAADPSFLHTPNRRRGSTVSGTSNARNSGSTAVNSRYPAKTPNSRHSARKPNTSVQHQLRTSSVINLSKKRTLTPDEISVLEFGLNFCPSVKEFNKEKLADDCFHFIRRLKLKEYFSGTATDTAEVDDEPTEPDRAPSKWKQTNPDYYPEEVRNNRSEGLRWFIDKFLSGCKDSLSRNTMNIKNNLTPQQRLALQKLATDTSIVIKPSDKCGKVVVMDVEDYDEACLNILTNKEHYAELKDDPNPDYKEQLLNEFAHLKANNLINKFEESMLEEGSRTPAFYGLPKLHKDFSGFPSLRPISSGSSSCTKRLSEFLDTFLKPLARKLTSYVQDTTDFVNKVRAQKFSGTVYISSMDVTSLYPNIDHAEGIDACEHFLERRPHKSVPSTILKNLTNLVLRLNTLCFGGRFFQQIKGTAMGTPMAVNYANLFMGRYEEDLLSTYEQRYGKRPALWLRFIDDIFVVWQGTQEEFKHFIEYCDSFAYSQKYKSNIRFTSSPPSKTADFLDTTVTVNVDGSLSTSLYTKPTASYQYLHRNSYHNKHVTNSLPKSQFMRIRRICSHLADFDQHSKRFIEHFVKRSYPRKQLLDTVKEVRCMNREDLLSYKKKDSSPDRVPLVLTYHHKFEGISAVIRDAYKKSMDKYPALRSVIPALPMVAFRRTHNIADKVVRARHHKSSPPKNQDDAQSKGRSQLESKMNSTHTITNRRAQRTCHIQGGTAATVGSVYAAECTKHNFMYIGQTQRKLSNRFTNHKHDAKHRPEACKLAEHFHANDCSFDSDLRVSVLEQVTGSTALREYKEDRWITRLQTISPNGMNASYGTDFGAVYDGLFK